MENLNLAFIEDALIKKIMVNNNLYKSYWQIKLKYNNKVIPESAQSFLDVIEQTQDFITQIYDLNEKNNKLFYDIRLKYIKGLAEIERLKIEIAKLESMIDFE